MNWNIEFYREDDKYCAYIGSDGGSGIEIREDTKEEMANEVANYILDLNDDLDAWDGEDEE